MLVLQFLFDALPIWHYAVLIGYDAERNVALLHSGGHERVEMRWHALPVHGIVEAGSR